METDVEMNCLRLSGSKAPQTHRPKNHTLTPRLRQTDRNSENKNLNFYLSTRVMEHPTTPPNSPLVMQMYNHKKSRESVTKKIQEQTESVKKKRLVYLKTSSSLEPIPSCAHKTTGSKNLSPRHSYCSDSFGKSSVQTLPPINAKNNNSNTLTSDSRSHNGSESSVMERLHSKDKSRQNKRQPYQENDAFLNKSNRKIKFDAITIDTNRDYYDDDDNDDVYDNDYNDNDDNDDNYDDNDDSRSFDSMAIQSISVSNCNHYNSAQHFNPWRHHKIPKNISWCPLQESYKGYLYKANGDIVLTKKYQPPYQSNLSTKRRTDAIGKYKTYNKMYRWGHMEPGRISNQKISTLSISGTHA